MLGDCFFPGSCSAKFPGVSDGEDRAPFVTGSRSVALGGDGGGLQQGGFFFTLIGLKNCVYLQHALPLPPLKCWSPIADEAVF